MLAVYTRLGCHMVLTSLIRFWIITLSWKRTIKITPLFMSLVFFFFFFFFCGSCCLLRTQCSYLTLICHLTAGVTSSSKILGLGQTPVELYMWRVKFMKSSTSGSVKCNWPAFCHFRRYDSFRHCSSVFKCRSLAFIADERLESVVERIWAIFNLYVLPFFVVVVVVFLFFITMF